MISRRSLSIFGVVLLLGCTASPMLKYNLDVPAQTLSGLDAPGVQDDRARFREIFCSTLRERPDRKQRPCEQLLHRLTDEEPSGAGAGPLPAPDPRLHFVFVPGLFNDCASSIAWPFETAVARLLDLGYKAEILPVNGRSSSAYNAKRIAEFVSQASVANERLVLVGYSKGAADLLEFLVANPELAGRVSAVVSVAGAINGSPLADAGDSFYERSLRDVSLPGCGLGDAGAIASLRRSQRLNWLVAHHLPRTTRYFSLVSFTRLDAVSGPLRPFAAGLAQIDPRNDGLLLFYDQVIPGATLLGYVNADHWAVAVPIEEKRPLIATLVTGHNWFPRDTLVEAVALYLSEQLATGHAGR